MKKRFLAITLSFVCLMLSMGCEIKISDLISVTSNASDISTQTTVISTTEFTLLPEVIEVTISAVGDCTIGTDPSFNQQKSLPAVLKNSGDPNYLFRNVDEYFLNDDYTIANLETTFTDATEKRQKSGSPNFFFRGDPKLVETLILGGIDATNLANNHTMDYKEVGYTQTKETLEQNDVGYFGYSDKLCITIKGIKFAFIGYSYSPGIKKEEVVETIKNLKDEGYVVVVNFHWGHERVYRSNDIQKNIAHYSIDAGADLILGHHPHVLQGVEEYKGKYIFYSLGNFCFGGNHNPPDKDTVIIQSTFIFNDGVLTDMKPRVIPCKISSVDWENNFCPTPATGSEKTRIIDKINQYSINTNFNQEGFEEK